MAVIRRFAPEFTELWDALAPRFEFAVRRDAAYLNWKYVEAPHVRYSIAALRRGGELQGYVVYRHLQEPRGRVTTLVDFLVDPDDEAGMKTLLRWVDREARAADSDKIRVFCLHAEYRRVLRRSGYFQVKSTMEFTVKVNGVATAVRLLRGHRSRGTSRSAIRTRTGERAHACSSASTPKATTSGSAATPASTRPSRTSTRCRTLHALFERARRAADLRRDLAGGQRRAVAAGAALPPASRRLRDWRAPSRVGNAALHARRRAAASVCVVAAALRSSRRSSPS